MRFSIKRWLPLLIIPVFVGLAFATADSGVLHGPDGKGCGSSAQAKKACSADCAKACCAKQASSSCGTKKASSSCSAKQASSSCASKSAKSCGSKASFSSCGSKASSASSCASKAACKSADACNLKLISTSDGLRLVALGKKGAVQNWLSEVSATMYSNHSLRSEVHEAKDGYYLDISAAPGNAAYNKLVQQSKSGEFCETLCSGNGCPPKA